MLKHGDNSALEQIRQLDLTSYPLKYLSLRSDHMTCDMADENCCESAESS